MILLNDYTLITQGIEGIQYAIFPLIPILIGMAVGAAAIGLFAFIGSEKSEPIKGNKIAVLGMQEAGKTTFYNMLRYGKPGNPDRTQVETYESFDIKISDTRTIRILAGTDIGGSEAYIRNNYKDMIEKNDCIIFIFNINKYINDCGGEYRNDTNARFEYLYRHVKEDQKELVVVGSHLDELNEECRKSAYEDFLELTSSKRYSELFGKNCFMINMCNKESVNQMMVKLLNVKIIK